ncbi:permease-like cell division protein FtsX [Saccharomonospora xinjiangensis]|uniref:Cell division protein FtsX n=1 Tax=Saccharomonospora xinjiangensis XJ-54 TaxID=882086 RepID=I0V025_9PSEU|nr:permease-like cell division protein FtsX [Saccharomonospora xinjiangensis]EID53478.1 cell division protein [Saccharomonospora xinjiangensis XJ-54]QBQ59217.1 Cell division protein FtsX [Saccharomonospora xinjiangensis]
MRASFVFSEVFTGLRRNVTMTIAMILTTAISLGMFGGGLLFVRTIDKMKANYLDDVQVTVYLNDEISSNDPTCSSSTCTSLRQSLETNPAVESVVYENRDQAYKRFQEIFAGQPELVELARPESLPSSLQVKLVNPERSEVLVQEYSATEGVYQIDDQNKFLERFFGILNAGRNGTFIVALIAALAAVLLIANTIQVSAFTRRTEVGIMRLVGATRWYTQLPFLLEAVVAGVAGAVLGTGGLVALNYLVLDSIIGATGSVIPKIELVDILFPVAPILLGTSVLISAVTGYATLRLYVRH